MPRHGPLDGVPRVTPVAAGLGLAACLLAASVLMVSLRSAAGASDPSPARTPTTPQEEGTPTRREGKPAQDEGTPAQDEGTPAQDEGTPAQEAALPSEPDSEAGEERAVVGERFPALKLTALYPGSEKPAPLDLGDDLGKRPILLVYFIPTYEISEEILQEIRRFVASEIGGKLALYPVVRLGRRFEVTEMVERARLLGIEEPVILDEEMRVQKALGAGVVPAIALIDAKGLLDFTGATSLGQMILEPVDLREAIRIAARGEDPPIVIGLMRHFPASDLVGERFRDLMLPDYKTGESLKLSDHVRPGRVTALLYWGAGCSYSRKAMPGFLVAHRTYGAKFLDIVSIVRDRDKQKVEAYAAETGITFPILQDRGRRFTTLYRVVSTPTLIVIRPDGVVDSVYTSGEINYFPVLQAKVRTLVVKPSAAPRPEPPPASPPRPR